MAHLKCLVRTWKFDSIDRQLIDWSQTSQKALTLTRKMDRRALSPICPGALIHTSIRRSGIHRQAHSHECTAVAQKKLWVYFRIPENNKHYKCIRIVRYKSDSCHVLQCRYTVQKLRVRVTCVLWCKKPWKGRVEWGLGQSSSKPIRLVYTNTEWCIAPSIFTWYNVQLCQHTPQHKKGRLTTEISATNAFWIWLKSGVVDCFSDVPCGQIGSIVSAIVPVKASQ